MIYLIQTNVTVSPRYNFIGILWFLIGNRNQTELWKSEELMKKIDYLSCYYPNNPLLIHNKCKFPTFKFIWISLILTITIKYIIHK